MTRQATLILNKNAGNGGKHPADDFLAVLREAGYDPVFRETEDEDEVADVLADVEGLVIVGGGDGSLRTAALQLVGRSVPLSLIPLGTANNIAHTFGLKGDPLEIVRGLESPRKRHFDIGRLTAPWGESYFLEGAGFGFFADTLALYDPEQGKSILRGISTFTQTLANYGTYAGQMRLDGESITDDYLMVEVLNTKAVGPRLSLAPDADPNDGFIDIVCVHNDERTHFLQYITGLMTNGFDKVPSVRRFSGKRLEFDWDGFALHVDAEVHPPKGTRQNANGDMAQHGALGSGAEQSQTLTIEVIPHALELWLPSQSTS